MGPALTAATGAGADRAELEALIALARLPGLGDRGVWRVLGGFGTARRALSAGDTAFRSLAGAAAAEGRAASDLWDRARDVIATAEARGLEILAVHGARYPARLEELHDPPPVLFAAGDRTLLERPAVAIVGARRSTEAGRRVAEHLAATVARAGVVVVSGMALGIDGAAHRGALSARGATIAVLGSGADRPTPTAHARMYRQIREQGLVVSEFFPGTPARPHSFPRRNRVIAALSQAVVVVAAARRSGAFITVDHALDLGREVFAVPGGVESSQSQGTNGLIRDGARILLDPEQLLEELGLESSGPHPPETGPPRDLGPEAQRIWRATTLAPRHVDQLARSAGVDTGRALAALTELEMAGWVVQLPGMRYAAPPGRVAETAR